MTVEDFSSYPKEKRDLTNSAQNAKVLELADYIYKKNSDITQIEEAVFKSSEFVSESSSVLLEAIKCATSKSKIASLKKTTHFTLVFAMYNETARLSTFEENKHGEDCLREKVRQLRWLEKGLESNFSWNIIAVDDGCPNTPSSYDLATQIVKEEYYKNVEVLKLEDAIQDLVICKGFMDLETTSDSIKGGAITYGLWHALNTFIPNSEEHILAYTDADLSTNLAQSGLLVHPIVSEGKKAAIGHRYGIEKSVLVKNERTSTEPESTLLQPGKLIILLRHYARKTLLPQLEHIKDTQAGFKAFEAESLRKVAMYMEFMNETFDVELLLRFISEHGKDHAKAVPFLFVEDLAMSNFPANHLTTSHLEMFEHIVEIYEKVGSKLVEIDKESLDFWKKLEFSDLERIIDHYKDPSVAKELDQELFNYNWENDHLENLISYSS